jgi:UDP-N-acetylglucosamine:LPS N-acetylglucosamine transferase
MNIKICFAASSGGHYEQLLMLRPLIDQYDSFLITERTQYEAGGIENRKIYYLKQVNRKERLFLICILINIFLSLRIFLKEKPDVIITTGVLAIIPICIIAKVFGKKLIYIESFSKVSSPTLTGKFLYKFADQFYVQWEKLLQYYPKALFKGGLF